MQPDVVTAPESREVEERRRPRSAVIFETIRREGEEELERSSASTFWSALSAGLSMSFSMIAMGIIVAHLPPAPWRPLVAAFGYTVGFLIVILGRQQLFTENTLTPLLPLFSDPKMWRLRAVARVWGIILGANLLGAVISSLFIAKSGAFSPEVRDAFAMLAQSVTAPDILTLFVKGIFAGWLIALMVWLLPLAEQLVPVIIIILTWVVAAGEFGHIIAGSVEALYGAWTGATGWADVVKFVIPTFLGNAAGGVAFVAAISSAEISAEKSVKR